MINANPITKSPSETGVRSSGALDEKSKAKLARAVKEFQSLFVGYMLKAMRSTIPKADGQEQGFGGDIMEGMFDLEMARHVSNNSAFGLGEMLYKQMAGEDIPASMGSRSPHPTQTQQPVPLTKSRSVLPEENFMNAHPALPKAMSVVPHRQKSVVENPARISLPKALQGNNRPATAQPDTVSRRISRFDDVILRAGEAHSLDVNLLKAVIASESGGNSAAKSKKDAKGLMQLIDSTATEMGVKNVWNPSENIMGGAKYLKQMLDRFDGDLKLALASYNAGPGAVEKHKGIPPYKETQDYIKKVLGYMEIFEKEGTNE